MELEHEFTIPVPVDKAWPVLLDIRRIAPCMPGAAVDSVDGDDFTGSVKVKLGPINLTYKGQAKFVEKDESAHKAVIDARGRDSRGNGTAAAKITATLNGKGDAETSVKVVTDLNITGKPAQFGRGVMVDVGNKLIGQFADCLAGKLGEDDSATSSGAEGGAAGAAAGAGSAGAAAGATTAAGAADKTPTSSIPAATSAQADADKKQSDAEKQSTELPGFAGTESAKPNADARESAQSAADQHAAASASPKTTPARPAPAAEPEPIDLIELAGGTVLKKAIPAVLAALIAAVIAIVVVKKKS
ncbi:SRPBCC family protein [Cumulibacter manganitolerans]|uniref:SRPBCC family protein n=1 Tax=Cumulibacter manganitolerans TaxID=1884992 RepID=UPI00129548E5|nr:SRPBCC family protein [Cumulibacter manganitolerans]